MAQNCSIQRDSENRILSVKDENGKVSRAFNKIRKLAPLKQEEALNSYLKARSQDPNIDKVDTSITFNDSNTGESFSTYREALNGTKSIDISVNGTKVANIKPTYDTRTPDGIVNTYIKDGIISEQKEIRNGKEYFTEGGRTITKKGVNKQILMEDIATELSPKYNHKFTDNGIEFSIQPTANHQGREKIVNEAVNNFLKGKFGLDKDKNLTRKELEGRFKEILGKLGVKVVSMDQYTKKHNTRNSVDSSVEALADITNKLIAYTGEGISLENLSEETAHFVIENLTDNQKKLALEQVHLTEEWTEFSDKYYEVYSEMYKGDQLELAVKTEVLGKILAKEFLKTAEPQVPRQGIGKRLMDAFNSFISRIRMKLKPSITKEVDKLTNDLTNTLINEGNTSKIADTNLDSSRMDVLYSLRPTSKEARATKNMSIYEETLTTLDDTLRSLIGGKAAFSATKSSLDSQIRKFNSIQYDTLQASSIKEMNDVANSVVNHLETVMTEKTREELRTELDELHEKKEGSEITEAEEGRLGELRNKDLKTDAEHKEQLALETKEKQGGLNQAEMSRYTEIRDRLNKAGNETFDTYQMSSFMLLSNRLKPLLTQLNSGLKKSNKGELIKKLTSNLENTINKIENLENTYSENNDQLIEGMIDDISERFGFDSAYKEYAKQWMSTAQQDTSYLHKLFGLMSNSQDPLLTLGSFYGQKIFNDTDYESTERLRHYQNKVRKLVKESDLKQLFDKGYLVDYYDQSKMNEHIEKRKATTYLEVVEGISPKDQTPEQIQETIEKSRSQDLKEVTLEQSEEITAINRAKRSLEEEAYFISEYYKDNEKKYNDLNISEVTRKRRNSYTSDRLVFLEEALIVRDGQSFRDYSQLSKAGEERVNAVHRERKMDKQLLDGEGNLKNGLTFDAGMTESQAQAKLKAGEITQYVTLDEGTYYIDSSILKDPTDIQKYENSIIALDLQKLDQHYWNELQSKGEISNEDGGNLLTDSFLKELRSQETEEAKKRFIDLNSTFNFTKEFWDTLDPENSTVNVARKALNDNFEKGSTEYNRIEASITRYSEASNKRKGITSQFKERGRPFEIDTESMFSQTKEEIERLDSTIREESRVLRRILEEEGVEMPEVSFESEGVTEVNESFKRELEDSGLTIDEFVRKIYNENTNSGYNSFKFSLERVSKGRWGEDIHQAHKDYIEEFMLKRGLDPNNRRDLQRVSKIEGIKEGYLSRLVPSYHRRFIPKAMEGVNTRTEDLTSDQIINLARNSRYIELRPNYSYLNEGMSSEYLNPNYNPESESIFQPKKGKDSEFISQKFQKLFGGFQGDGKVARNQNLYDAMQVLKDMNREVHENTNRKGASVLEVPQIYEKGVDRLWKTIKKPNVRGFVDNIKELAKYREDDLEFGTKVGSVNTIPVFYARKLKNQEKLSDELWTTFSMNIQQSILHKNRKKNAGKFGALLSKAAQRNPAGGKLNESSVAHEMLKNYMDYAVYGQRESIQFKVPFLGREVDLTRFSRFLLTAFRMKNLALSPIVPITSFFTESIQYGIDKQVGEVVDKDAGKLANKEFMRLAGGAVKDVGKIYSDSELNILMESLGVRKTADRYKNSNHGYVGRFLNQLPMGAHQAATFPLNERIALSVLYNFRIVDGDIINYANFRLNKKIENRKITEKEIRSEWKKHEGDAVRNFLEVKENSNAKFSQRAKELVKPPEGKTVEQYLEGKLDVILGNTRVAMQRLDTMISEGDRIQAQRNFAMSFLTTHKQWLSIVTQNRFKRTQRNLLSGQIEKGSYRTLFDFFGHVYKEFGNDKLKAFQGAWNGEYIPKYDKTIGLTKELEINDPESYARLRFELQDLQRRNMHRIMVDTAYILGAITISAALYSIADDDEYQDNYAIQMANYIAMRTVNQQLGNQTGVPFQWWESLKSPIVGLENMGSMATLPIQIAMASGEHESGFYKGRNKRSVIIEKTIPGMKVRTDLSRLNDKADQYYYFNNPSIRNSGLGMIYSEYVDYLKDKDN